MAYEITFKYHFGYAGGKAQEKQDVFFIFARDKEHAIMIAAEYIKQRLGDAYWEITNVEEVLK